MRIRRIAFCFRILENAGLLRKAGFHFFASRFQDVAPALAVIVAPLNTALAAI